MTTKSKAVYLGNTDGEYYGFTVGKEYDVDKYITENDYIGAFSNDGDYRHIKNGAFHKFGIQDENGALKLKIKDESISKEKQFKYYINGELVTKVKFDDTLFLVKDFESDGIDTSSIKFEVKFE